MNNLNRVLAIASKEWQLNLRFPVQYFAGNLISPVKSAVLMLLIYRGFLSNSAASIGDIHKGNFMIFVLLGTTCHSLFTASVNVFSDKLLTEKWWQTVVATLVSPATAVEVILGFMIGSGGLHLFISLAFLTVITVACKVTVLNFILGVWLLLMLAVIGFGIGLMGATVRLCFEGQSFIFDYGMQAVIFFSCFYYPIEMIPKMLRGLVVILPTYQLTHLLQQIYLSGYHSTMATSLLAFCVLSAAVLWIPAFLLDYSIRKFGIVGY